MRIPHIRRLPIQYLSPKHFFLSDWGLWPHMCLFVCVWGMNQSVHHSGLDWSYVPQAVTVMYCVIIQYHAECRNANRESIV